MFYHKMNLSFPQSFSLLDLNYNDDYLQYLTDFKYIKYSSGILTPWHNNIIARTQKETLYDTILKNKDKNVLGYYLYKTNLISI